MKVTISPCSLQGKVFAPASKSDAHRLLLCAGLCEGQSKIENIAGSQDIKATLGCLEAIGARIIESENGLIIEGINPQKSKVQKLFCNESGTTLRFFIPLCLLSGNEVIITGSERLLSRPLTVYEEICKKQNILFENDGKSIRLKGRLCAGEYEVKGNISSQFISGLLFALPLLEGDSILKIIPPFESKPYVDMTLSVLKNSGISIAKTDDLTYEIKGNQSYKPICKRVEGDWSNGAFWLALKYMGNNIEALGLDVNSLQGDKICTKHFEALKSKNETIDLSDCPDLAPILFAYAGINHGATFLGTDRLKIKESDRISDMARELIKFGIELKEGKNSVTISGDKFHTPKEILCGHNDHRIVMTMAVLLTKTGGTIDGAQAVNKSYPDFFEQLEKLGVNISYGT